MAEHGVDLLICQLPHVIGKIVLAVRMLDSQPLGMAVQLKNLAGGGRDAIHAIGAKVTSFFGAMISTCRGAKAPTSSWKSKGISANRPR